MLKLSRAKINWDTVFPLILIITILITRIPFMSKFLYEWDSANYALAFTNYNIVQQQPHPPGYLFYVALGRGFNYVFNDPNTSLIALAIFFSALSAVLLYFMTKEIFSRRVGIASSILFIFNPLIWFYGEIASIYIFEAFFSILIAYSCYKLFRGDERFIYLSAMVLGLAGGFRTDLVEFMFPLWVLCILYAKPSFIKFIKGMAVFALSILSWLIPTALSVGGIHQYLQLLRSTSAAADYTSIIFGASISQQILNSGACIIWSLLGLTVIGILTVLYFLIKRRNVLKNNLVFHLKKPLTLFFLLWAGPAFIFYLLIYVVKPGYLLTCIPVFMVMLAYIMNRVSGFINIKFPEVSAKKVLASILVIYALLNAAYFIYPGDIHNGDTWETPMDKMSTTQEIWFDLDVGLIYNNAKISANDENTALHIQNILNISNSDPSSTIIIIRDITREDEGFNWRKAMYYLPGYDVYYLFNEENSGITANVSSWHGKNHSYTTSKAPTLDVPMNSSTTRIVWIMSNQTSFYQEVKSKVGVNSIKLPNGLNIYYSQIGNQTSNFQISGFIFRR
ncbi:protein O-mannosyl-transferase family [Methanobacterium aggregans]|uniref:protein O-mannosyl-transferase family n=1 Tax=Methanobacterium aggregans TaxID=1615586 RepID=UPI001AE9B93E|nr:glycosyltransferase family 39 protein [Methanobacterium aggregans]MBP2046980.1 hypothetical protein [Methanobacterium aggregans]